MTWYWWEWDSYSIIEEYKKKYLESVSLVFLIRVMIISTLRMITSSQIDTKNIPNFSHYMKAK